MSDLGGRLADVAHVPPRVFLVVVGVDRARALGFARRGFASCFALGCTGGGLFLLLLEEQHLVLQAFEPSRAYVERESVREREREDCETVIEKMVSKNESVRTVYMR